MGRKELKCTLHPVGSLKDYKFVVVCTFYQGKAVLSRHVDRDTWETQGGHIEAGETPMDAAKRELFEESGITDAALLPVCDYHGYDDLGFANGVTFAAVAEHLSELPPYEMAEIKVFEALPGNLTYPEVTPLFIEEAKKVLGECYENL